MNQESGNKEELDQKVNASQYAILEAAKENIEKKPTKAQETKAKNDAMGLAIMKTTE